MIFTRNKSNNVAQFAEDLLDSMRANMLVIHKKSGKVLFMNAAARDLFSATSSNRPTLSEQSLSQLIAHCCVNDIPAQDDNFFLQDDLNQQYFIDQANICWLDQTPSVLVTVHEPITSNATANSLYNMAYFDSLTNLPNRAKLKKDFNEHLSRDEKAEPFSVFALFDIDHFKRVNDTYGHNAGDLLLQRLAQHLMSISEFQGHLYRLGGDEFVLAFFEESTSASENNVRFQYYEQLLQRALYSYTMPNIDMECTISMGVATLPAHGKSMSEMLRKADIALYKAKEGGRNKMVIFEEWYDTVRTFSDYYINIRPILSVDGTTYGYELTDNTSLTNTTSSTLNLNSPEFNRALEALDPEDLGSNFHYFVRYSHQFNNQLVLDYLPKGQFILTLPEHFDQEALEEYRTLKEYGYDFSVDATAPAELLKLADYIRVDVSIPARVAAISNAFPGKKFIALGVDTAQTHEQVKKTGVTLYQGRYLSRPVVVKTGKEVTPLKANYLRLIALSSSCEDVEFKNISAIITQDVALTYKLFRLLNSTAVGLRNRITSVHMAVAYMGEENLKKWIALLALRGLMEDSPSELVRISLIRAHFGELLCREISPLWNSGEVFLCGIFSLLHTALETTKEALLSSLSLSQNISRSLLTSDGPYSELLEFFSHYEYSNWDFVAAFSQKHSLSCSLIYECYISSVKWYNALSEDDSNTN